MLDYETKEKVRKVAKSTSDYLTRVANEPSVGLYHVQDHIRRSIPKFVDIQREVRSTQEKTEEVILDVDYSLATVKSLHGLPTFTNVNELMNSSIARLQKMNQAKMQESNTVQRSHTMATTYSFSTTPKPSKQIAAELQFKRF